MEKDKQLLNQPAAACLDCMKLKNGEKNILTAHMSQLYHFKVTGGVNIEPLSYIF